MRKILAALIVVLSSLPLPCIVYAEGVCLYPTGGYQFYLGGNQGEAGGAPTVGARLEYNFSRADVNAVGLVYSYGSYHLRDMPDSFRLEQHFCLLGYRFAYNWTWASVGSLVGTGAVVRVHTGNPLEGTDAEYALQIGVHASFRPFSWMEIGPDFSYWMSTDMDRWIFGGGSSYYLNLGGHVGIYF